MQLLVDNYNSCANINSYLSSKRGEGYGLRGQIKTPQLRGERAGRGMGYDNFAISFSSASTRSWYAGSHGLLAPYAARASFKSALASLRESFRNFKFWAIVIFSPVCLLVHELILATIFALVNNFIVRALNFQTLPQSLCAI